MDDVDLTSRFAVEDTAPLKKEEFPFDRLVAAINDSHQTLSQEDYKEEQLRDSRLSPIVQQINEGKYHSSKHLIIKQFLIRGFLRFTHKLWSEHWLQSKKVIYLQTSLGLRIR
jgi:hypothetical protein